MHASAVKVREKAFRVASAIPEAAESDLDIHDGRIFLRGLNEHGISLGELAAAATNKCR